MDSAVTVGLAILFVVVVFVGYPTITETLTPARSQAAPGLSLSRSSGLEWNFSAIASSAEA